MLTTRAAIEGLGTAIHPEFHLGESVTPFARHIIEEQVAALLLLGELVLHFCLHFLQGGVRFPTGGESPRTPQGADPVRFRGRRLKSGWEKEGRHRPCVCSPM